MATKTFDTPLKIQYRHRERIMIESRLDGEPLGHIELEVMRTPAQQKHSYTVHGVNVIATLTQLASTSLQRLPPKLNTAQSIKSN